jgi:asparagine synthase (glutamine-hydrolysing)
MPGLAGIIESVAHEDGADSLQTMIKCMMHEKFYASGTYINNPMKFRVGWVCHKNSYSDCMPVWNERKDVCLVFSGESAMDESELESLRAKGHQFSSENASALVHMYEELGIRFLEKLNGWFSGALVDDREGKGFLFNDRYGMNRIYYHEKEDVLYFASEAKSLLKVLPGLRNLDTKSLGELFSCRCVLENRSLFPGISLMPAGSVWEFSSCRKLKKEVYFKAEIWENQPQAIGEEYYERLKEAIGRIIPRYFRGPEQVGVSLTGGIDTRMIMAWASAPPLKVPCYTFGGMYRDCADVKVARKVAAACQQRHTTVAVKRKFFSEFSALAKKTVYYTDGAMDVSGAVELYVNRIAREIAPVRLTGNYGDQVVRRAIGFKPTPLWEGVFDLEFSRHIGAGFMTYDNIAQGNELSFLAFKQVPWHHHSRSALERTQLTVRSPFLDNDLVALVYQAPPDLAKNRELSLRLIADGDASLSRIPTDRGIVYRPFPLTSWLNNSYQEFSFKAEYAYDYGMPQWLARLDNFASRLHLEKIFLGRHKFYHFRVWYRDELSRYVKDVLLDPRTRSRGYLQGSRLEEMVKSHITGYRNYTEEINWILTSELIQRQLIEQK